MKISKKVLKSIISFDLALALIVLVIVSLILPNHVNGLFTKDIYYIGISVLSIVFTVYFAAFAIIISASDNDFIRFLEEENDYSVLLMSFKITICIIFIALLFAIILYWLTSYMIQLYPNYVQPNYLVSMYAFLFSYSMFAVFASTLDSISYASFRGDFLVSKDKKTHSEQ